MSGNVTTKVEAAAILGITPSGVADRVRRGIMKPGPWTRRYLESLGAPLGNAGPRSEHGTDVRWWGGCRCAACTAAHSTRFREDRRRHSLEVLGEHRADVLEMLAGGASFEHVEDVTGLSQQRLHGIAAWEPVWRAELDAALMAGRDPGRPHGTARAYRLGCRCPECREAKQAARNRAAVP